MNKGKPVIRARAFLAGALLIPLDAYWVAYMEGYKTGPYPTTASLFANAVFILCVLICLNNAIRRLLPRQVFSQAELLVTYTMVCIGASLAGLDMVPVLLQMITYPFRYATPANGWNELFGGYLPKQFMVSDPAVLKGYFEGHSSVYSPEILRAWMGPVLWWTGFIFVLVFVMMCINVLVRKQWIENERLTFPIMHLPLAITDPESTLWSNKLFWGGFAIAGGIDILNGLAYFYPNIPQIAVWPVDLAPSLTTKPWNAVGWTPYSFYPMVIGLGFLLPTDLSFSCWFFYLFWKMQLVTSSLMAWDTTPEFPFIKEQTYGAYVAVVAMVLWSGRKHLKLVLMKALGLSKELDDSTEAMSYRAAILGALAGGILLTVFFSRMGMSPLYAASAIAMYYALSLAITRMRAELGPPVHDLHFCGPDAILTKALGTESFGARNLTIMNLFFWFNRAYRGHPMPVGMEGMKMAHVTRASQRSFLMAVMAAAIIGSIAAFWAFLHLSYIQGMGAKMYARGHGWEAYMRLERWIRDPQPPNYQSNMAMITGFVTAIILAAARLRFVSWPFHPIGYAISGSWSMNLVWLPLLLAWIAKVSALRFGGLKFYKQVLPLFLGLILGEVIVGCGWSLVGMVLGVQTYPFWGK